MRMRTVRALFSTELRKVLAYRVDFWLQFLGTVLVQFSVAWFLWSSVFRARGVATIGGYHFEELMLYYLLVPLTDRLVRGFENFILSREIYDGSLTRYLIYPVSFFGYKYVGQMARMFLSLVQLAVGLIGFACVFGIPGGLTLSPLHIALGLLLCAVSSVCYFFIATAVELVAFWADNVWSLMVMLRFVFQMLGGALIPLEMFPRWAHGLLLVTPFPYIVAVPVRILMGKAHSSEIVSAFIVISAWTLISFVVAKLVWRYGTREYTGVGI